MSLFICSKCKAIENTALVLASLENEKDFPMPEDEPEKGIHIRSKGNLRQLYRTDRHPCYALMDMQGFGCIDHVEMLCCECNTGKHHNEFPRTIANEDELKLATYSKYNLITPFDHVDGTIISDDAARFGYRAPTEEEEKNRSKKGKALLAEMAGLAAGLGGSDIFAGSKYFRDKPDRFADQTELEKKKALMKADLKRQIKELKRSGEDPVKLSNFISMYNKFKEK